MADETIYTVVTTSNDNDGEVIDAFSWRSSEAYAEIVNEWDEDETAAFPYTEAEMHEVLEHKERLSVQGGNITITVVAATEPQVKNLSELFTNQLTKEIL